LGKGYSEASLHGWIMVLMYENKIMEAAAHRKYRFKTYYKN
jgi:hypothetical protein